MICPKCEHLEDIHYELINEPELCIDKRCKGKDCECIITIPPIGSEELRLAVKKLEEND